MYMYIWLCGVLVAAHRILSLLHRVESLVTACELLAAACAIWLPERDGSQVPLHWEWSLSHWSISQESPFRLFSEVPALGGCQHWENNLLPAPQQPSLGE